MKKSDLKENPLNFQEKYSKLKKEVLIGVIIVLIILIIGGGVIFSNPNVNPNQEESNESGYNQEKVQIDGVANQKGQFICDPPYYKMDNQCCLDVDNDTVCDEAQKDKVDLNKAGSAVLVPLLSNDLPEVTKGNIVGGNLVCDLPYIRHAQGCCLDVSNNHICDLDEAEVSLSSEVVVSGCTNVDATNYNSAATVDDGGCVLSLAPTSPTPSTASTPFVASAQTPNPTPSPTPAPVPTPTPASPENTGTLCSDGLDNDQDGVIDWLDSNCEGKSCDMGSKSGTIIWSHSPGEDQSIAPPANSQGIRRIGCCASTDCRTRDGAGECRSYDQPYLSTYGWICGDNNNWDRCGTTAGSNKGEGDTSDGEGYVCETSPVEWIPTCVDSDAGWDLTSRGTVTGAGAPYSSTIITQTDSCTDVRLNEVFCNQLDGRFFVDYQTVTCPSGTSCVSGACVSTAKN